MFQTASLDEKPPRTPMAEKKCYGYGKLGHIKANCPIQASP